MLGASDTALPEAGQWQMSLSYRGLESDTHYSGSVRQREREELGTYVVNKQQVLDFGLSYSFNRRLSLSLGIPLVKASWAVPTPIGPTPGPRAQQDAEGLGDVSLTARSWLWDPGVSRRANVSVGLGVKAPTGDHRVTDTYPPIFGGTTRTMAVDQSVQLGDGGWGALVELQAFRTLPLATLYASGTYLINPRDTNSTPSILPGLGIAPTPETADLFVNSVPDQYVARAGAVFPVQPHGLALSAGARIEGLPRYDLVGDSHGFRRPGYEIYFEPGLIVERGASSVSMHVPVGVYRNRQPNPYTGRPGDATFPDFVVLFGYGHRF